jgi:hypothetical protein
MVRPFRSSYRKGLCGGRTRRTRPFLFGGGFQVAGITLAQAEEKLAKWMAADDALARSQSYTLDGRTLTRADAGEVQSRIVFWNNQVKPLSRGGVRMTGGVPL